MNYEQTLDYLYTTLPMFSRMGSAAFKKDLANIQALCMAMENPQNQFKTIHVGGTNGKGSVSHMLASALQEAGYRTGLYTSPHLYDFRERIKINGELCSEVYVVDFINEYQTLIEKIKPSFFEITVAMAFEYFNRNRVDIAVIEVGLGGKLDSTNIIHPLLSVITNIGWDHMNMLGNTLQEIAVEKAGIIKEQTPVVIGEKNESTAPVFVTTAETKQSSIYFAEDYYQAKEISWKNDNLEIEVYNLQSKEQSAYTSDLAGIYQKKNICTFLKAIDVLNETSFVQVTMQQAKDALRKVKATTGLSGRWEILRKDPAIVLEVAHNKDGMEQLVEHLACTSFNKLHLVIGMVKDKDVAAVLSLLPPSAMYYFTQAQIPRALPSDELASLAGNCGLRGKVFSNVNLALEQALLDAGTNDLILVTGSIFLVAEVNREKYQISGIPNFLNA